MLLLTPDKLREDKKEEMNSVQFRSIQIAQEEDRLVHSLNITRDSVEEQKKEIAIDFSSFKRDADRRKTEIEGEIDARRKALAELMKPVDEVMARAQEKLENAGKTEAELISRLADVAEREREVSEHEKMIPVVEAAFSGRENRAVEKEVSLSEREKRIQESGVKLSAAQKAHAEGVRADYEEIARERSRNETEARINVAERGRLEKQAEEQANKDRQIADKYASLEAAIREWKAKGVTI